MNRIKIILCAILTIVALNTFAQGISATARTILSKEKNSIGSNVIGKSKCEGGDDTPHQDNPPGYIDDYPSDSTDIPIFSPMDPNEIVGTRGYDALGDTLQWVAAMATLPYTIYFENDPELATAAAQKVEVRHRLHAKANISTFTIGAFGFGNHIFTVEGNHSSYQQRLDLTQDMGIFVDIVAGIDIVAGEVFWILQSIDPATGLPPQGAQQGFLPVNDENHSGEGFVSFTIKPKANACVTGDELTADASIVFDLNEAIPTNVWHNTVDALPPTTQLTGTNNGNNEVLLQFSGLDDSGGCGIKQYKLYVSDNYGAYSLYDTYPADSTATFLTEFGHSYRFFCLGEDNVGNVEAMKEAAEFEYGNYNLMVSVAASPEEGGIVSGGGIYVLSDTCTIEAIANEGYTFVNWTRNNVEMSTDPVYEFVVTEGANYVAHFSQGTIIQQFDITATANPEEGGSVTGTGTYDEGTTATLTATANEGYTFINWTKDGEEVSTIPTYSFTVTEAGSYVAHFELNSYEITATANPEAGGTVTGAGTYNHFETCTLTATANEGYTFINWTKDGEEVSTIPTYSFTVTEAGSYVAHFELNSYEITATANPEAGGTVTGAGTYNHFESCTLTATANEGYTFINWTKDGEEVSITPTYSFTVTEASSYVAHFELSQYQINASANPNNGGTVTGAGTYYHGTTVTLTATANAHYYFVNWTKDGVEVSTSPVYSFVVTEDGNYVAHFNINSYEITAIANPEEGGSITGTGTYNYGTTCTLNATANPGYTFIRWTKDGVQVSTSANYSFTVTEAATYVAHFTLNQYLITVTANPNEGGIVYGGGAYWYGSNCTLMASANNGYHFVNWTKNGVPVSSDISYTFTVTETADYVGHFALNQYQINVTADPTDGGSVTGSGTYGHGETVTLAATANNNYHFVNWTKNGYQVSTNAIYTFTATETADYVAHFEHTIVTHEVTTEANPVAGGTTAGDGTYAHGTFCTVTASANEGYTFINWTKNGNVVSTNAVYRFVVNGDTHLVAHFQPNDYLITVSVDPQEGGTVNGAGTYTFGHTATLTVMPNENYVFQNWTENDVVVSEDEIYSFEVTGDRSLVAHLMFVDGINEQGEITVLIYPNPASNILTIETSEPVNLLEIFTHTGALVYSQTDCPAKMEVQVGSYSNGTYLIRMTTDNTVLTRMFMKK